MRLFLDICGLVTALVAVYYLTLSLMGRVKVDLSGIIKK